LSFVLALAVRILQRWYFPRIVAVLVVGLFAFTTIFGLGALMVSQVTQLLPVICPATGQCFGKKFKACGARLRERETLERASEFLQDRSKDKGVGSERTAAAGCRSGIFADHVSPIVNGHIYFDPVELGRSPPDPVRVLLQGGHIAIAVRKNSVLRLLLGKAVGAFIGRGCITLSSVEQACLTVSHKIGLGEFSVRD
jgi:hypothetical protein